MTIVNVNYVSLSDIKKYSHANKQARVLREHLPHLQLGRSSNDQLQLMSTSIDVEFSLGQSLSCFFQDAQKIIIALKSIRETDTSNGFYLNCHCSKIYCAGSVIDYLLHDCFYDLKKITDLMASWESNNPDRRKRILFSGSRDYNNLPLIKSSFAELPSSCVVVVGDARGVDAEVARLAIDAGIHYEIFPALWDLYGLKAGVMRNNQMLESGIDYAYIFMQNDSPGATHVLNQCLRYNLPYSLARHTC